MEDLVQNIISGSWWISLVFLAVVLALIFVVGRTRLSSLLISTYLAFVVTVKSDFSLLDSPAGRVSYFIILMLIFSSVFYSFFQTGLGGGGLSSWVKLILLSIATTGLIMSIVLSWYPKKILGGSLSPFYLNIFTSDAAQIFWVVIPLVLLILFKRRG
ncbi:MAG TPA: hypothetical protein GX706_03860 [Candidatus Moranbacteria bacterium]|nr:hypothetical protein [Candidatus Moranbacteria bacterium]